MSSTELPEHLRHQIRTALTHYAKFYAHLVSDNAPEAEHELTLIGEIDKRVRAREEGLQFQAYHKKRTQLMRIFRSQLLKNIEGQVQEGLLEKAEGLLGKLEIERT
jgi:hypothetical protein